LVDEATKTTSTEATRSSDYCKAQHSSSRISLN